MLDDLDSPSIPAALRRIALAFRFTGWIGFWSQLVLAVVSTLIFLFAAASARPAPNPNNAGAAGTQGGVFFAVLGLFALFFSIYQAFRYTRFARQLQDPNPNLRPKKADALKLLRFGLLSSLVGMSLSVLGAEAITGTLLAKSLSQAQGAAIYDPQFISRLIQPLDIFVVLANTHTIAAHFIGILASIWLISRVNQA